jgi:hypothetical protein
MTNPKRPTTGAYADCAAVMQQALKGDLRLKLKSRGAAINFRQRCYQLRKLLLLKATEITLPGQLPSTPYDTIYIQWDDAAPEYLTFRTHKAPTEVEFLEPPAEPVEDDVDELLKAALELRQSLLKGTEL